MYSQGNSHPRTPILIPCNIINEERVNAASIMMKKEPLSSIAEIKQKYYFKNNNT